MLKADEDGRFVFLCKEIWSYISTYKWNRENEYLLPKISNFVQFNIQEALVAM